MKPKNRLTRRSVKEIERSLKAKHAKLKESLRSAVTDRCTNEVGRSADTTDFATETLNDEIRVALLDRNSRQIAQIETALERLAQRKYGVCHDCEEFIGMARLRALPFAERCRSCQSRAELRANRATQPLATASAAAGW